MTIAGEEMINEKTEETTERMRNKTTEGMRNGTTEGMMEDLIEMKLIHLKLQKTYPRCKIAGLMDGITVMEGKI